MAYDLEEQEQIATLKGWWKDNGNFVLGALVAVSLAVSGWFGWRNWQATQAQAAGAQFEALVRAAQGHDLKAMREAGAALAENYSGTVYASLGALASARTLFERGDLKGARAQLQWVLEKGATDDFKDLARLRMAAVLLDEKGYDEALKLMEAKPAASIAPQYAAMKGDLLVAKNQPEEARTAYRAALEKPGGSEAFRVSVQMRLDALGG
ncbi:MAG: tetratricopeptide repeat protein [Proteobacteria bacterium]|nr:tetratricopeptide repeat protein [Pseudomonadota bacterium]